MDTHVGHQNCCEQWEHYHTGKVKENISLSHREGKEEASAQYPLSIWLDLEHGKPTHSMCGRVSIIDMSVFFIPYCYVISQLLEVWVTTTVHCDSLIESWSPWLRMTLVQWLKHTPGNLFALGVAALGLQGQHDQLLQLTKWGQLQLWSHCRMQFSICK